MAGLISDLVGKASAGALATVNANLTQAIVTSQTSLEVQMDTKVSTQELVAAIATRHPLITTEAPLSQSLVSGLQQALASTSSLLPNVGPATFTGNLTVTNASYAGSLETGHALLTPRIVAPSTADLTLRNYGN